MKFGRSPDIGNRKIVDVGVSVGSYRVSARLVVYVTLDSSTITHNAEEMNVGNTVVGYLPASTGPVTVVIRLEPPASVCA